VFSTDDTKQMELAEALGNPANVRRCIGDVRDLERLREATKGVDFVFHAAALKHVDAGEYNPLEFVKTNILGTANIITACRERGVQRLILVSTDKAVNPACLMGGTKFVAERLIIDANRWPGTRCACVRLGNVRDSRGSLIPKLRRQAAAGGPLTVTSRDARRFFIKVADAGAFILSAMERMSGGEVFIPNMPELGIADFIEGAAEFAGVGVKETGFAPGEKDREELYSSSESPRLTDDGFGMVVIPEGIV
jgi:UDP-N-acetylglucosamine 4,6-dehydratase